MKFQTFTNLITEKNIFSVSLNNLCSLLYIFFPSVIIWIRNFRLKGNLITKRVRQFSFEWSCFSFVSFFKWKRIKKYRENFFFSTKSGETSARLCIFFPLLPVLAFRLFFYLCGCGSNFLMSSSCRVTIWISEGKITKQTSDCVRKFSVDVLKSFTETSVGTQLKRKLLKNADVC